MTEGAPHVLSGPEANRLGFGPGHPRHPDHLTHYDDENNLRPEYLEEVRAKVLGLLGAIVTEKPE